MEKEDQKILLLHGTSMENWLSIKNRTGTPRKNWRQSDINSMYFYSYCDLSINDARSKYRKCCGDSYYNARMSAAIHKSQSDRVVILAIETNRNELSSIVKLDESDGLSEIDEWCKKHRVCMKYSDFIELFLVRANPIFLRYDPSVRWKYLYNAYRNCGTVAWDDIKDYVVDPEEIISCSDNWYKENDEYEWFFDELFIEDKLI